MAWVRAALAIDGETVEAHVRVSGGKVEAVIPWRAGVGPGGEIGLDDGRYAVSAARDPGGRHELLELTLEPAGPAIGPSGDGPKRPARKTRGATGEAR